MNTRRFKGSQTSSRSARPVSLVDRSALREDTFLRVISHERKRAERAQKPSLLMLIEIENQFPSDRNGEALETMLAALATTTRETDVMGWYKNDSVIGVMFTEIMVEDGSSIVTTVMARVSEAFRNRLSAQQFNQVSIYFHLFPEVQEESMAAAVPGNAPLFPDPATRDQALRLVQR